MTASRRRSSQEFKDEFCRVLISTSMPIGEFVDAYGVDTKSFRNWLTKHREANGGTGNKLTVTEPVRLKELERR